jgi:hypothetical protein
VRLATSVLSGWCVGDGRPLSSRKINPNAPGRPPRWPDFFCQGSPVRLYFEYSNEEHTRVIAITCLFSLYGLICFRFGVGSKRRVHGCRSLVVPSKFYGVAAAGRSVIANHREGWRNRAPCEAIRMRQQSTCKSAGLSLATSFAQADTRLVTVRKFDTCTRQHFFDYC